MSPALRKRWCKYIWVDINRKKDKNVQMGWTQRQFSFSNYEAIKRMRATLVLLNTFPKQLGSRINYSIDKYWIPWKLLCKPYKSFRAECIFFFWQQENLSSRTLKIGIAKTETKSKHISSFWGGIKVEFCSFRPIWKKIQILARKVECNYVMMSWEKMAKKNCHAKHDGCCFSITTLLVCSSGAKWHNNSSLLIWQAEMQWYTTSFCFMFFLDMIMSGLWNGT